MEQRPVKIFTTSNVPRLRYIAEIILGDILGLKWEVITDKRKLGKSPVINYSEENIEGTFKICPVELLFERGVESKEISITEWKGLPVFFQTSYDSDLPFDIFAASFFLVSRYEEYLDSDRDEYGRFRASCSIAFRHQFLDIPVIDLWAKEFARNLVKRFQTLAFKRSDYSTILTVDVDEPFAYIGKNLLNNIGGLIHDITKKTGHAGERYGCLALGDKDPYEVFDYLLENIEYNNSNAIFFFSVGDQSEYDRNPSWKNEKYRKLIKTISGKYITGIHPSFHAAENSSLVMTEVSRLRSVLNQDIHHSRFHYLRLMLPSSYRYIHNAGISEDFSMGYPDEPGFRAGIARPFFFYDVAEDQQTTLKVIPFQIMDVTLSQYKNLDPLISKELILKMIGEVRKAGGVFVSIWHNTSLLNNQECDGWREVFEFTLGQQVP